MSPKSIAVRWDGVPPIDQNGIITVFEVLYVPLNTFGGVIGMQSQNTADMLYLLENLEEYVNYSISVRAYTSIGPGPYSDPIISQTLQDGKLFYHQLSSYRLCSFALTVPASPPSNVSAEVQSSTSIFVIWEAISLIDQNGVIIAYEVLYEPLQTFNGNITEQRVNTTNVSITLMNLEEFVSYSISVRGYTIVGPGNYSLPVIITTLEDGKFNYFYFIM